MRSFRTRMTILIVLVVLASSVLMAFISYRRARSSLVEQLEDNYAVEAQKYALELASWISTNATIIDTLAAEIAVNDISEKGYDEFHAYLKHSNDLLNRNGYVYDVYFTYPDNFMVCASDFVSDGTVDFVHEREWYTTSALTGKLFYSAPYRDSDTGKPIITLSKAVYRDEKLLGVLAADIFVDVLVDMIENADTGEGSYAFLMDQSRRMIVHPDSAYDYEDKPYDITAVPGSPYRPLVSAMIDGNADMVFVNDYDGVKRGISYSKMPNTGWYVCIATDEGRLEEGVDALTRGFVLATLVAVLVGIIISVFLARVLDKLSRQEQEYQERVLKLEKEAADKANEAKSRFLADMSHEIRTPINTMIGMNEMILREAENSDIRSYSRSIRQSGRNLLQLINGILDFSKIEDGKMEIVPVRYSVGPQIAYIINSISERAVSKGLKMEYDIDPTLPRELFGDDTRINQIVINLLTNAVKYTEKGSVTLSVREKERPGDGRILMHFDVTDTGIGIKESDMEKIFESFERLDVVRNRNIEGTGLGMTITRMLLELMGSSLNVSSTYGKGSSFSFDLWQKIENDEPLGDYRTAMEDAGDEEAYTETFRAENVRILVVDDTRMNIVVVENLLKKTGITIDSALNGNDAVNLAKENVYDVILMDQRMPGMDGTETMKLIREDGAKNASTPVICLTADVVRGAKDRYMQMGFDDYLTKPVDGARLESMLLSYIPADRIVMEDEASPKVIPALSPSHAELFEALTGSGIDTAAGQASSGGSEEAYIDVLAAFAQEERTKSVKLADSYAAKDWKEYGIYAHSLKSTSKTIGAASLGQKAAVLEAAAGRGDAAEIEKDHDEVLGMYEEIARIIRDELGTAEDEGDILEFTPGEQ